MTDIMPAANDTFAAKFAGRYFSTPKKMGAQTAEANINAGIAAAKMCIRDSYGDFHPIFDSKKEMMWIGGGAGMAPLRAQIMHLTKTLHTTHRVMNLSLIHISGCLPG